MISKGSCDTEDWSNDAENSAFHHRNKLHLKIHFNIKLFKSAIIFHSITGEHNTFLITLNLNSSVYVLNNL